ncbi:MAG TPA: DivIVA domain-containing protein [Patescibacteria group bacterium]|jgi:cell division initiation protein|nr:DivIVA domain-containing protein [Patescibacteria group bacterium]
MLTPMEIHNKEFKKVMRGYKEEEVDEFLDKVVTDFEKLYRENGELKDKLSVINDKVDSYNLMEKTLQNTLVVAQTTAEDVVTNARKKSEVIIQEAEEQAKRIVEEANRSVVDVHREYENLKKEVQVFKTRFRTLLESELEALNVNLNDL